MKRLAIFLDGTWNEKDDHTNVIDLHDLVEVGVVDGIEQRRYYHKGVGTSFGRRLIGGAVGQGLSDNVLRAYRWIVEQYEDGDEIYLFGFSRGAYTARSVAGLIVNCGLLRRGGSFGPAQVYERYRRGKKSVALYDLVAGRLPPGYQLSAEDKVLLNDSRRVNIHFIGVWDTVGALGVPWTEAPLIGRRNFYFHNTNPSVLLRNAFHALAVDEQRGPFKPTLWTQFTPESAGQPPETPPTRGPGDSVIEQRWFIGAHSNVGGGYKEDRLRLLPCAWLQARAAALGLRFTGSIHLDGSEYTGPFRDSYAEFMGGIYKFLRLGKRFHRTIGLRNRKVRSGWSNPINEWIDASVFQRYQADAGYRPVNLQDWARRRGVDLASHRGATRA